MIINNLGTVIFSYFFGKKVGEDDRGNKYYLSKNKSSKKWVLYKNKVDPTNLPAHWQLWLTTQKINIPLDKDIKKYYWQKKREPNSTGTEKAYHPAKVIYKKKDTNIKHFKKEENKKIWRPN